MDNNGSRNENREGESSMSHDRGCHCGREKWEYEACVAQKGMECARWHMVQDWAKDKIKKEERNLMQYRPKPEEYTTISSSQLADILTRKFLLKMQDEKPIVIEANEYYEGYFESLAEANILQAKEILLLLREGTSVEIHLISGHI